MAEQKRFYWIKLKENFFDLETIDWLISQKNGCEYIVLYQKLCLLTANKEGRLAMQVGEMIIPYDVNKIARDTKFSVDTVIVAMELFKRIGLIFEEADGILKIPYISEIVGSETPAAIKKRKQREKKKQKLLEGDNVPDNVLQEIEKEKREKRIDFRERGRAEEEIDLSDEHNRLQPFKGNLLFSENQLGELLDIMGLEVFNEYASRLDAYIENNDVIIKSHYKKMLEWYKEDCKK